MYRSPFKPYDKDMAGVARATSQLPEGSTGILFLSRGERVSGHFINLVTKGWEVQYWCGQTGRRSFDPIKELGIVTPRKTYPVLSVDLIVTSRGGGPVIKGRLPR